MLDVLLPSLRSQYGDIEANQEDWGWFAWFSAGRTRLAVDIFCDDPDAGAFRVHLVSRVPRRLFGNRVQDTPELAVLQRHVVATLGAWVGAPLTVMRLDEKFLPAGDAA